MRVSENGINFIKNWEKLRLEAYLDQAGTWTIGWGTTTYRNGQPVKKGDKIIEELAEELFTWQVLMKEERVNELLYPYILSQNKFDALVSFAYNEGTEALAESTLLKKIRKNQNDPAIQNEFKKFKYVKAGKLKNGKWKYKVSPGLMARRQKEWELYNGNT